jgi:hypothetical protein
MSYRNALAAVFAALFICQAVLAEDENNVREEILDMKAKVATLQASEESDICADSLIPLKRKGAIRIGGDVNVDLLVKRRDDLNRGDVNSTTFTTNSANLRFRVEASANSYLYLKLDLDDFRDAAVGETDLLEEVKYVWNNVRGSNWGLVFGKGEVPYGQDKTLGIIQSYHHNDEIDNSEGPAFLLAATENGTRDSNNPHANVGNVSHPGEVDNKYMLAANYTFQNKLKLEFALFQNATGMHEDRSDDTLFFQSFSARAWYMPVQNLTLQLSFINLHNDSARADTSARRGTAYGNLEDDAKALSAAFDWTYRSVNVFGEYQHGWDWNFTDNYDTDTFQLGLAWDATSAITLGLMGEYLRIDDENNRLTDDYYKAVLSAKYRFDSGMFLILEYGHEWFDRDASRSQDYNRDGDMIAFRAGWTF